LKATHRITQTESRKACKINYAIVEDGKLAVLRIPVRNCVSAHLDPPFFEGK